MSSPPLHFQHSRKWWLSRLSLTAMLVALSLTTSVKAGPERNKSILLPNPKLIGCKSSNCPQMLPDPAAEEAVSPWQVSLDFADGKVIGLTALYDQPVSINEVRAAIDARYLKWANKSNDDRTVPVKLWRIEPETVAIQLCVNDDGMVQLIYLIFDARHPLSEPVRKKFLERFDATHPSDFERKMLLDRLTPQSR